MQIKGISISVPVPLYFKELLPFCHTWQQILPVEFFPSYTILISYSCLLHMGHILFCVNLPTSSTSHTPYTTPHKSFRGMWPKSYRNKDGFLAWTLPTYLISNFTLWNFFPSCMTLVSYSYLLHNGYIFFPMNVSTSPTPNSREIKMGTLSSAPSFSWGFTYTLLYYMPYSTFYPVEFLPFMYNSGLIHSYFPPQWTTRSLLQPTVVTPPRIPGVRPEICVFLPPSNYA